MALVKCKECGQQVSNKAKTCPQCGAPMPKRTSRVTWMVTVLLGLVFINWLVSEHPTSTTPASKQPGASAQTKAPELSDAECMKSLQCWGERQSIPAEARCQIYVEKLSTYSHKWTDGLLERKFSHFRWKNQKTGLITFVGDKIEFQNGFGAYQKYIYECDYDPFAQKVLDVRARPGRIPS